MAISEIDKLRQEAIDNSRFGKRLIGRLMSSFGNSRLHFTGSNGVDSSKKVQAIDMFYAGLPNSEFLEGLTPEQDGFFKGSFPKVAEALLFTSQGAKGTEDDMYVREIGSKDFQNLLPLAVSLSLPTSSDVIALRVVHGATNEMPFRALSSFLPGVFLLEKLKKAGATMPQLQVISAHNISGGLNDLDMVKVKEQAQRLAVVGKRVLTSFFPSVSEHVTFLEDDQLDALQDELSQTTKHLGAQLPQDVKNSLKGKNGSKSGADKSMNYAAAHLLMHDIRRPGIVVPISTKQPSVIEPDVIISMGGAQERFFYNLRHTVRPYLEGEFNLLPGIQYITRHTTPPYYMARGGDASLADVIKLGNVPRQALDDTAHPDLFFLNRVLIERGVDADFLREQKDLL